MAKTVLEQIQETVRGRTELNAPMREHTTIRVGGPADLLIYPADRADLRTLLALLAEREVPHFVVGNGSNLVVRDGGIRGAVINLGEGLDELERIDGDPDAPRIRIGAGVSLRRLVRWCVDQGIGGFEALSGIPGHFGGAAAMNAGAWGMDMGDRIVELEVLDPNGEVKVVARDLLHFEYRSMDLAPGHVILGGVLAGQASDTAATKRAAQELFKRRRDSQPLQEPSAGSVFKNPPGRSAGQLIDECGLKGVRVGDTEVSRLHANFIVNLGAAQASQVVALMGMIQERVYVRHKIKLEPEVRIVGHWQKGKLRIKE